MSGTRADRSALLSAVVLLGAMTTPALGGPSASPQGAPPPTTALPAPRPNAPPADVPPTEAAPKAPSSPVTEANVDRDGVRATLRALAPSVEVGEPLRLRLDVEAPADALIRFPTATVPGSAPSAAADAAAGASRPGAPRPTLGEFELRSARMLPLDPARPLVRSQELELVSFASGMQEIPAIELRREGVAGSSALSVGPLWIEVRSLVGDVEDPRTALRPVKEAVDIRLPRDWRTIAVIAAAALVLLAIGYAGWKRLRRAAPPVIVTPQDEARQALARLHDEHLPESGRVFDFYVRLSDIVRRYVERRFGIRAPEQTTKEFLAEASRHPSIVEGHRVLLSGFLRTADRVKFAAERPGSPDCDRAFEAANGFVEETAAAHPDDLDGTSDPFERRDERDHRRTGPASARTGVRP